MKKQLTILYFICIAAMMVSCKESEITPSKLSDNTIGFNIGAVNTRSTAITSDNIVDQYGSFICDIQLASLNSDYEARGYKQHYVDKATVKHINDGWQFQLDKKPTWLVGIQFQFWAWAPETVATRSVADITPNADQIGFSYALPAANGASDASNQKDLIFAYSEKTFNENDDPKVTINFRHALSEVRFIIEADDLGDIDIPSIKFENVASSGAFTFSTSGAFTCTASGKGTFGQDNMFSTAKAETLSGKNAFLTANNFFMIPQTLGDDTKLTIKRTSGESLSAKVGGSWEPGKYYTYRLSVSAHNLEVTLVDWRNLSTGISSSSTVSVMPFNEGEDGEQL